MWIPVAVSDQVTADKPMGIALADQGLVLFRDKTQRICALEDRCPHRRVPLSLGKVIDGNLRCAYHGWTFEGQGGQCVKIPNLAETEKLSPQLRADAFVVREEGGFVYLQAHAGELTEPDSAQAAGLLQVNPALTGALQQSGREVITTSADAYLRALLDGPHLLMALNGVCITDFFLGDVVQLPGSQPGLQLDRTAIWTHKAKPHERQWGISTLVLRTEIYPEQSAARLQLLDVGERPLVNILLAVVPGKRNTVQVNWRCSWLRDYAAIAPPSVRWRIAGGRCPLRVFGAVDGRALADLLPGPSVHLQADDLGRRLAASSGVAPAAADTCQTATTERATLTIAPDELSTPATAMEESRV